MRQNTMNTNQRRSLSSWGIMYHAERKIPTFSVSAAKLSLTIMLLELLMIPRTVPVNHHVRRRKLMLQLSTSGLLGTCIMSTTRNGSLKPHPSLLM